MALVLTPSTSSIRDVENDIGTVIENDIDLEGTELGLAGSILSGACAVVGASFDRERASTASAFAFAAAAAAAAAVVVVDHASSSVHTVNEHEHDHHPGSHGHAHPPTWQTISTLKRQSLLSLFPPSWILPPHLSLPVERGGPADVTQVPRQSGIMSVDELRWTEMDVSELVGALRKGEIRCLDLTVAFLKRATIAQQLVNCLTDIHIPESILRAQQLDSHLRLHGPIGPLHGLPISVKDCVPVKGHDCTVGYVSNCFQPEARDAEIVTRLKDAGAVVFAMTNVPMGMYSGGCKNTVFGETLCPLNRRLTPGGSSGGEAALLAMRGSPLGVGSDWGGSIRLPAAANRLFGFKPSVGRFPVDGVKDFVAQYGLTPCTFGPMSQTLEGLEIFTKALAGSPKHGRGYRRRAAPSSPWRQITLPARLTFGVSYHDRHFTPHPPVRRAIDTVVSSLLAAGHEVIEYYPDFGQWGEASHGLWGIAQAIAQVENVRALINRTGEPLSEEMASFEDMDVEALKPRVGEIVEAIIQFKADLEVSWDETGRRTSGGRPIDGLITAGSNQAGLMLEEVRADGSWQAFAGWNLADYPVVAIPVSRVTESDVRDERSEEEIQGERGRAFADRYHPNKYLGAGCGIQLIAREQEDEKVMAMAKVLVDAMKKHRQDGK